LVPSFLLLVLPGLGNDALGQSTTSQPSLYRPSDPLNKSAFNSFYNLEFDRAVQDFQRIADKYPEDAFAANHLLTAVLFRELYRMGALNSAEYANNSFVSAPQHAADPKAKDQIRYLINRALRLEQTRLQANPKDVDALYARGVTRAQYATYTALVEHAWVSALRNALGARHDHEKVLDLDPNYVDAKLVVGAHNYVVGSLPWGFKVATSLVGLSGNREKGLEYLREAATGGRESSVDAKVVLMLFLRREHRLQEAFDLDRELVAAYPQSSLLKLEQANLLRDMGKSLAAADVYREVWQAGQSGRYPGQHYEAAALGLGDLLRNDKNYLGAAAAYELLTQIPAADPEIDQKAGLAASQMYDLQQKRDLAVKKYEQVIALKSDSVPADAARRFLKSAYRE
jgi:hypothetical protein